MFRTVITAAALALALAGTAQAQDRVQAGTLTCDIAAGVGLLIGSQRNVSCTFSSAQPGWPPEYYTGTISRLGPDIGVTFGGQMVWAVWAPTTRQTGALAGSYAGASAEASVVAGLGANALIGGNNRTVALQPFSVQGQGGLNLFAGISNLDLTYVR